MAKSKTNDQLDKAIDKILNDYQKNLKNAARWASTQTTADIYQYSQTCLEQYYNNYDPTSYERTKSLQCAILPYKPTLKTNDQKTFVRTTVGIVYDSSKLEGIYNGSKKYQPVDGEYVLINYLYGIHPGTDGSSDPETVIYYERYDELYGDNNPWNKMEKYLTEQIPALYAQRIMNYLVKSVSKQLEVN